MAERRYRLSFTDFEGGFFLKNESLKGVKEYEGDIGLWSEFSEDGVFLSMEFQPCGRGLDEELKEEIKTAHRLNIPGRYDVPELGIKNATFIKVLEAIKKYYETKKQVVAKQKRGTNAPAY